MCFPNILGVSFFNQVDNDGITNYISLFYAPSLLSSGHNQKCVFPISSVFPLSIKLTMKASKTTCPYFVLQAFYLLECCGTSTTVFLLHWLRFLLSPTVCVKLMNLVVLNETFIIFCSIFNHAHHLIKTRVGSKMRWQCLAIRWLPPVLSNSAFGFPVIRHVLTHIYFTAPGGF